MSTLRHAGVAAAVIVLAGAAAMALSVQRLAPAPARATAGGATYVTVAGQPRRVIVTSLQTGGEEAAAGLRVGDVVETVNGRAAESAATIAGSGTGKRPVVLRVRRDGDVFLVTL